MNKHNLRLLQLLATFFKEISPNNTIVGVLLTHFNYLTLKLSASTKKRKIKEYLIIYTNKHKELNIWFYGLTAIEKGKIFDFKSLKS